MPRMRKTESDVPECREKSRKAEDGSVPRFVPTVSQGAEELDGRPTGLGASRVPHDSETEAMTGIMAVLPWECIRIGGTDPIAFEEGWL